MPYGDGTGPLGRGPRTGRGMGRCLRYFFFPRNSFNNEEKLKLLKEEKEILEKEITDTKKK